MAEVQKSAVQLPPASIDFNAFHDALAEGRSGPEALGSAIVESTLALSADEAAARAVRSQAELPNPARLNKTELLAAGEAEGVLHARNAEGVVVPFAEATNDEMRAALEAKRAGSPILPDQSQTEE